MKCVLSAINKVTCLIGLVCAGAMLYRIPLTWGQNKLPWKLLHAALMLLSLILAIVGLCAVFDFHNAYKTPNMYSVHSWIGITAVALFAMQVSRIEWRNRNVSQSANSLCSSFSRDGCVQWVVGLGGFLLPCSPLTLRKLLKPVHVWLGCSILLLTVAACISGINEKLFFVL